MLGAAEPATWLAAMAIHQLRFQPTAIIAGIEFLFSLVLQDFKAPIFADEQV
jgi:hypothetical protein